MIKRGLLLSVKVGGFFCFPGPTWNSRLVFKKNDGVTIFWQEIGQSSCITMKKKKQRRRMISFKAVKDT